MYQLRVSRVVLEALVFADGEKKGGCFCFTNSLTHPAPNLAIMAHDSNFDCDSVCVLLALHTQHTRTLQVVRRGGAQTSGLQCTHNTCTITGVAPASTFSDVELFNPTCYPLHLHTSTQYCYYDIRILQAR